MLDKRSAILLMAINKQCLNGSYQVVEIGDLISSLPKKYLADENVVAQSVAELERSGYVDVKYHDSEVFCLCPLPKGRMLYENHVEKHSRNKKIFGYVFLGVTLIFIFAITSSFLGVLLFNRALG